MFARIITILRLNILDVQLTGWGLRRVEFISNAGTILYSGVVDDDSTDETSLALLLSTAKVPSSGVDVAYELGGTDIIVDILDASLDIWAP